jgi:hypothetical protein
MTVMSRTATAALVIVGTLLAIGLATAGEAGAAKLRPVGGLRVDSVGTRSIDLRWKDRSRGETAYEIQTRAGTAPGWDSTRAKRGSSAATAARLKRGTRYAARVRACKRRRCARWGRSIRTATLLAPVNGPHPDPGCSVFPAGDEFNRDVSTAETAPNSSAIIDRIDADGGDLVHPDFGSNPKYGIPYTVVPAAQPAVPIRFGAYADESDRGPYPVPPGAPVEGGGRADGDRHVLVVRRPADPGGACELFELYRAFERSDRRNSWRADSGAAYDLGSPLAGQRPDGWTSADAAGLPIYPGLVTYEEAASGEIDHAIRITFERTRRGYIAPATHFASDSCNPDRPPMGLRLRLGDAYDISGFSGQARVIAEALKTYGAIVADNGSNWYISGSTDRRWNDDDLDQLKGIPGDAFEVVDPGPETSPC